MQRSWFSWNPDPRDSVLDPFPGTVLRGENCHLYHFWDTEPKGRHGCRARIRERSPVWTHERPEREGGLGAQK